MYLSIFGLFVGYYTVCDPFTFEHITYSFGWASCILRKSLSD